MQKGRRWCFTINNPDEHGGIQQIEKQLMECQQVTMFIMELEHGDENAEEENQKTPHLQGYLEYSNSTTRQRIENLLLKGAWIQLAKEPRNNNIYYCRKEVLEGTTQYYSIKGLTEDQATSIANEIKENKSKPKRRKSVKYNAQFIKDIEDLSYEEIKEKYPSDYYLHLKNIIQIKSKKRRDIPPQTPSLRMKNYWIYGRAGTGKSSWVHSKGDVYNVNIYQKKLNKWWDGFIPGEHQIVLIDDFIPQTDDEIKAMVKNWADRGPLHEEIKGGFVDFHCMDFCLVVTSNYTIDECYYNGGDAEPIKRRFLQIDFNPEDHPMTWRPERVPIMPFLLLKMGVDPANFGIDITDDFWMENMSVFHYTKPIKRFACDADKGDWIKPEVDQIACKVDRNSGDVLGLKKVEPCEWKISNPRRGYEIMNAFKLNNFYYSRELKLKGEQVSSEDEEPEREEIKAPKSLMNVQHFQEEEDENITDTESQPSLKPASFEKDDNSDESDSIIDE